MNTTVTAAVDKVREARMEESKSRNTTQTDVVRSTADSFIDLDPLSQEDMTAKKDTYLLLETVKSERRESQKFDQYLQSVLNDFDPKHTDKTFDRSSPLFFTPRSSPPSEFWGRSGIEPSVFADCVTPRRPSSGLLKHSRESSVVLFDTSTSDEVSSSEKGSLSDNLTKLKDEIKSCRLVNDVFERELQLLIDAGVE